MELVTRYVTRFVDFLFLDNPTGTAVGALGGSMLILLVQMFRPLLQNQNVVDPLGVHPVLYICVGVLVTNYRRYRRGAVLPAPLEARLRLIRAEFRAGRIPREEAERLYRQLLEDTVATITADRSHASRIMA